MSRLRVSPRSRAERVAASIERNRARGYDEDFIRRARESKPERETLLRENRAGPRWGHDYNALTGHPTTGAMQDRWGGPVPPAA